MRCSVCQHPERESIDRELASGAVGPVALGRRYGLNRRSLSYHRERHLLYLVEASLKGEYRGDISGVQSMAITTRIAGGDVGTC